MLLLALNFFSAAQDVSVDSLAVHALDASELGAGNTIQVVAYKAGSVFAGGILLYLKDVTSWSIMFAAFGSVYVLAITLVKTLKLLERTIEKSKDKGEEEPAPPFRWRAVMAVPHTGPLIAFVLFYKLCERAEQTFSLALVDYGMSSTEMAGWSTVMRTFSLVGSTYGGYALSKKRQAKPLVSFLAQFCQWRASTIFVQALLVYVLGQESPHSGLGRRNWWLARLGLCCTCATLFCAGAITTATFSMMMRASQRAAEGLQGTHYTVLATFEVLGKLLFASISGALIDMLGLVPMFSLFAILAMLCVPFVHLLPEAVMFSTSEGKKDA